MRLVRSRLMAPESINGADQVSAETQTARATTARGVDVLRPLLTLTRRATPRTLPFYIRVSLVAQGLLVVGFALLRPADLAWWRIFGQTVRTGALFGVTVAVLALPTISRRTALGSILTGTAGGLGWNLLTGFSADHFAVPPP